METNMNIKEIREDINSYTKLHKDWDGYGAIPTLKSCANNALKIVNGLDSFYMERVASVSPNPNGTVSFDWEVEDKGYLGLEVGKKTFSYFVERKGEPNIYIDKATLSAKNIMALQRYLIDIVLPYIETFLISKADEIVRLTPVSHYKISYCDSTEFYIMELTDYELIKESEDSMKLVCDIQSEIFALYGCLDVIISEPDYMHTGGKIIKNLKAEGNG